MIFSLCAYSSNNNYYYYIHYSSSTGTDTDVIATSTGVQKALFDFVKRGNLKKVKEYESKGGQLTATDSNGLTPLHHAARLDKIEVAKYITENSKSWYANN